MDQTPPPAGLLRPAEAAALFRVAPRTVARWAAQGRLGVVRTPGGHRRYLEDDVIDLLDRRPQRDLGGIAARPAGTGQISKITEVGAPARGSPGPDPTFTLNGVATPRYHRETPREN